MKHGDLVSQMTLEEKCALLAGKDVWHTREIPRLNIPAITLSDGPSGLRKQAGEGDHLGLNASTKATCIPSAATLACSWDDTVSEAMGAVVGRDAANQGVDVLLAPGLNTKRSSLCGRSFEYYSEDPYISGKLAAGFIRGAQKQGVSACAKHYAANAQELLRMHSDSVMDERNTAGNVPDELRDCHQRGQAGLCDDGIQPRQRRVRQRKPPSAGRYSARRVGL
ncbi:MAG: glycoside hydrolase family 3 N-terminal domain-containing protein [Christensenellales bacterium]